MSKWLSHEERPNLDRDLDKAAEILLEAIQDAHEMGDEGFTPAPEWWRDFIQRLLEAEHRVLMPDKRRHESCTICGGIARYIEPGVGGPDGPKAMVCRQHSTEPGTRRKLSYPDD